MARTRHLDSAPSRSPAIPEDHDLPGGWGSALAIAAVVLFLLFSWFAMRDGAADEVARIDPARSAGQADSAARDDDGDGRVAAGDADGAATTEERGTQAPLDGEAGVEPAKRANS